MGARCRNQVFAKFITKNFPKTKSILVVADGKGELAVALHSKGYKVRVVETKPRYQGPRPRPFKYERGVFTPNTKIVEDLVVGMHPDEATAPIIMAARKQGKPWAVVPCCMVGPMSDGVGSIKQWCKRLKILDQNTQEAALAFGGRNIVLYKR